MQCPCCGAAALVRETRDINACGVTVPAVTGDYCPACGECVLDRVEGNRYGKLLAQGRKVLGSNSSSIKARSQSRQI